MFENCATDIHVVRAKEILELIKEKEVIGATEWSSGDEDDPMRYPTNRPLGQWVHRQRKVYTKNKMSWIEDFDDDFYGSNKTVQDSVTVEKASRMYDGQVAFQIKHEHTCGKCLSWKVFLQRAGGSKRGLHPILKETVMSIHQSECYGNSLRPKEMF